MSKKTKKEKIIAAYRKQLRLLREQQPQFPSKKETPVETTKVVPLTKVKEILEPEQTLPKYFI